MKSTILRIFPSWNLIILIKVALGIKYSILSIPESILVAFVWAMIHEILGNKTSYKVLKATIAVFVIGTIMTVLYRQCPLIIRIIYIAIGVYMLKVAAQEIATIELRNKDNSRKNPYSVTNIFGVKVIMRYLEAIEQVTKKGADALGVKAKHAYQGYSPLFRDVFYKFHSWGYGLFRISPVITFVYGKGGIAIIRTIDEAGNYEYKDGKWYKDGKKCTDFNKEASRMLYKLSDERGTNKVILVKTFEGGSVSGAGCGMFITDLTRGDKKLIDAVEKIADVEYYQSKLDKKSERISKAMLSLK